MKAKIILKIIRIVFEIALILCAGLLMLKMWSYEFKSSDNIKEFNQTYTNQQQCELVEQQVIYTKKWEESVLQEIRNMSWYSYSEYVIFTEKQEELTQQKIELLYTCSQADKISAYDFLTSVNKQNHQFYQLNEAYETTKKIMNEVRG